MDAGRGLAPDGSSACTESESDPLLGQPDSRAFDHSALEEATAHLDAVLRQTRHNLDAPLRASGG